MTPHERREEIDRQIRALKKELDLLDKRIREQRHALGLIGNDLQKLTWAPEISNAIPQIFSWTFEDDPTVKKVSESLFLTEGGQPVRIPLFLEGGVSISLVGGRLWLTAQEDILLQAVDTWSLEVEDLSHVFEKLERARANMDSLEKFCWSLFPLKEVPKP